MGKVTLSTMTATQEPIPKNLRGLAVETLQNLQTALNPVPDQHVGFEYWPDNEIEPTFNSDTHKKGSAILALDVPAKMVNITYNVEALDAGELLIVLANKKIPKLKLLKAEGLRRIQIIFPDIDGWGDLNLVKENWLSIAPAARKPTPKFQALIDTIQAVQASATAIKAMTNVTIINSYDVTTDPGWPT